MSVYIMSAITFITFNIFNSKYAYFNTKHCAPTEVVSEKDENWRNTIIINILKKNKVDIYYLQEASESFINLLKGGEMSNEYIIEVSGELVIMVKKTITETPELVDMSQSNNFFRQRIFPIKCKINKQNFVLINVHMPSKGKPRNISIKIIRDIVATYPNHDIIIAGDMNSEYYILRGRGIHSTIEQAFKRQYKTSFKLGNCEDDKFVLRERTVSHNFIDDIYISNTLDSKNLKVASGYDVNIKLIYDNLVTKPKYQFANKGSPYCDISAYAESGVCNIPETQQKFTTTYNTSVKAKNYQWPSDHALLYVEIIPKKYKLTG